MLPLFNILAFKKKKNWTCMCVCVCVCVYIYIYKSEVTQSCPTLSHPMDCKPTRLLCPWDFPDKDPHKRGSMPSWWFLWLYHFERLHFCLVTDSTFKRSSLFPQCRYFPMWDVVLLKVPHKVVFFSMNDWTDISDHLVRELIKLSSLFFTHSFQNIPKSL